MSSPMIEINNDFSGAMADSHCDMAYIKTSE
jgi:hypothetical protein